MFNVSKDQLLLRTLRFICIGFILTFKLLWYSRKKDKVLIVTNPASLVVLASMVKRIRRFEFEILVHDVFPENAVSAGILKKSSMMYSIMKPLFDRGDCTWDELQQIHDKMETELGKEGAFLDAIYICPHHKDKGFEGERPEYKFDCECRKPKPGLLLKAAEEFNVEIAQSYIIGDSENDVKAGRGAGVQKSFLIQKNDGYSFLSIIKSLVETA